MNKPKPKMLAECLQSIEEGHTLEQVLHRYPAQQTELRQYLSLAIALKNGSRTFPSSRFRSQARQRLISQLRARSPSTPRQARLPSPPSLVSNLTWRTILLWLFVALSTFALVAGGRIGYASNETLPGEEFYPVKTAIEDLRLFFSFNNAAKASLNLAFAQRRLGEIDSLIQIGKFADMAAAAANYQSKVTGANDALRELVIADDARAEAVGLQISEILFYNTLMLRDLGNQLRIPYQMSLDVAIAASKSGMAIASQWMDLALGLNPQGEDIQTLARSEEILQLLPDQIICWPVYLSIDPPQGIALCEGGEVPIPLPAALLCWPLAVPLDPYFEALRCEAVETSADFPPIAFDSESHTVVPDATLTPKEMPNAA